MKNKMFKALGVKRFSNKLSKETKELTRQKADELYLESMKQWTRFLCENNIEQKGKMICPVKPPKERKHHGRRTTKEQVIKNRETRNAVMGYIKFFLIILSAVAIIFSRMWIVDIVSVYGGSMKNTFIENDVCVVQKVGLESYKRYDVVVAWVDGASVIKRIIALPGETIQITDGSVWINGEKLEGQFGENTWNGGVAEEPYELSGNEYFLLGDNRTESVDSRVHGAVKFSNIKGIVVFRIYPFNRLGSIENPTAN